MFFKAVFLFSCRFRSFQGDLVSFRGGSVFFKVVFFFWSLQGDLGSF